MGNPQAIVAKVAWDHAWYWAVNCPRFMAGRQCDIEGMASFGQPLLRAVELTARMQDFFREWHRLDNRPCTDAHVDTSPFPLSLESALAGVSELGLEEFSQRLADNLVILEAMAVVLCDEAARRTGNPPPAGGRIDPYTFTLEGDGTGEQGMTVAEAHGPVGELANLRLDALAAAT